jgi:hypothetical protein
MRPGLFVCRYQSKGPVPGGTQPRRKRSLTIWIRSLTKTEREPKRRRPVGPLGTETSAGIEQELRVASCGMAPAGWSGAAPADVANCDGCGQQGGLAAAPRHPPPARSRTHRGRARPRQQHRIAPVVGRAQTTKQSKSSGKAGCRGLRGHSFWTRSSHAIPLPDEQQQRNKKEHKPWTRPNNPPSGSRFEPMSKRRRGYPSETKVKRGIRMVGGGKELLEKLGRNDLCPCGSGRRFQELLPAQRRLGWQRPQGLLSGNEQLDAAQGFAASPQNSSHDRLSAEQARESCPVRRPTVGPAYAASCFGGGCDVIWLKGRARGNPGCGFESHGHHHSIAQLGRAIGS